MTTTESLAPHTGQPEVTGERPSLGERLKRLERLMVCHLVYEPERARVNQSAPEAE
jgi:hypothetical protein